MAKTLVLAAALTAAVLSPAQANDINNLLCKNIGELARSIMRARMTDVPMSTLMAKADAVANDTKASALGKIIIIAAYKQPSYNTEAIKQEAIAEFGNMFELACYSRNEDRSK